MVSLQLHRACAMTAALVLSVAPTALGWSISQGHASRGTVLHLSTSGASAEAVNEMLQLCASTDRCQRCSAADSSLLRTMISEFEAVAPPCDPLQLNGNWRLVGALGDATYRSSPFFSAFRQAARGARTPIGVPSGEVSPGDALASAVYAITDAIPFYDIGAVHQTITGVCSDEIGCAVDGEPEAHDQGDAPSDGIGVPIPSGAGELVSRVELSISRLFGLPAQSSVMTTTSTITTVPRDADGVGMAVLDIELAVQDTQARQSTIAALLPNLDEALKFPSGAALDAITPGSSVVRYRTTYLTDTLRISRPLLELPADLDGQSDRAGVFVYVRES